MTTMMNHKELMENELNLVNGGADGDNLSEPFKKLMDFLDNYDETKDPFYFPDHKLPWDIERPDWVFGKKNPMDPDMLKDA